jgi:hypothetical protein
MSTAAAMNEGRVGEFLRHKIIAKTHFKNVDLGSALAGLAR